MSSYVASAFWLTARKGFLDFKKNLFGLHSTYHSKDVAVGDRNDLAAIYWSETIYVLMFQRQFFWNNQSRCQRYPQICAFNTELCIELHMPLFIPIKVWPPIRNKWILKMAIVRCMKDDKLCVCVPNISVSEIKQMAIFLLNNAKWSADSIIHFTNLKLLKGRVHICSVILLIITLHNVSRGHVQYIHSQIWGENVYMTVTIKSIINVSHQTCPLTAPSVIRRPVPVCLRPHGSLCWGSLSLGLCLCLVHWLCLNAA